MYLTYQKRKKKTCQLKKVDKKYEEKQKKKIDEIWKDMNADNKSSTDNKNLSMDKLQHEEKGDLNITEILKRVNQDEPKVKLFSFAGKTFDATGKKQETSNEKKEIQTQQGPKSKVSHTEYLNNLLKNIDAKVINSMMKSKYDWKDYTKQNDLEKKLAENRKDGYLEKARFLEKSRHDEKEFIKSKRQKVSDQS